MTKHKFKVGDRTYQVKQIGDRPYYISKCGEIISTVMGYPRVLKASTMGGYRGAIITKGGERAVVRHHHLVMRWWVKPRPTGMVINHKNGIKHDNRLENLEYCTPKENREHAKANRLYHSGARCSWSKLNEESALLIKRAKKIGMSNMQLARAFLVDKRAIQFVINGKNWRYHK